MLTLNNLMHLIRISMYIKSRLYILIVFIIKYYHYTKIMYWIGESNRMSVGQCPNTDTLGISETINPTHFF